MKSHIQNRPALGYQYKDKVYFQYLFSVIQKSLYDGVQLGLLLYHSLYSGYELLVQVGFPYPNGLELAIDHAQHY